MRNLLVLDLPPTIKLIQKACDIVILVFSIYIPLIYGSKHGARLWIRAGEPWGGFLIELGKKIAQ
jgi:hypothetical protein